MEGVLEAPDLYVNLVQNREVREQGSLWGLDHWEPPPQALRTRGSELAVSVELGEQQQEPADHTGTWKTGIAGVTGPGPGSCGRLGLSPPLTSEDMGPRK